MAKYEIVNFIYKVIVMCKTQEDANAIETILIMQYNSRNDQFGYNLIPGGNNVSGANHPNFGKKHSEETKIKRSKTMKKKCIDGWVPKNTFEANSDSSKYWAGEIGHRKGKNISDETKRKISTSSLGRATHNKGKKFKIVNGIRTYVNKEEI